MTDTHLLTMAEVEQRLRGRMGRKRIIAQLNVYPVYAGGPTHSRNGRKYLLTEEQFSRFIRSLECRSASSATPDRPASTSAGPSAERQFMRAQALIAQLLPSNTARAEKPKSMNKPSTAGAQASLSRRRLKLISPPSLAGPTR
jgi:hypothetical protein